MGSSNPTSTRSELSLFISDYCGDYFDIPDQGQGESDFHFRHRVAGVLRARGHLIEAHEVLQGGRWDSEAKGDHVVDGIVAALSIALQGASLGMNSPLGRSEAERGERALGDEFVLGRLLRHKAETPGPSPEDLRLQIELFESNRRQPP